MRKALKISGILFILYALSGFLVLPFAVKFFGQRTLQNQFGESATILKVKANPFTWELAIEGLEIEDPADQWSLKLARASVDISAATVYKFHPVFDAILIDTPDISYVRRTAEQTEAPATADVAGEETPAGDWRDALAEINARELPKIQIDLLKVQQGTFNFRDEANAEVYSQVITPINLELHEFTTAIENENVIRFSAQTDQGTALKFEATLTDSPITCSGFIELSGFDVSKLSPYYKQYTQFDLASAVFGMRFDYHIDFGDLDHLLVLSQGQLELNDILCRPLTGEDRVISLSSARLNGIQFEFPQLNLQVDKVTMQDGVTRVIRSADGSINLLRLVGSAEAPESTTQPPAPETAADSATEEDATALTYNFDSIEIRNYQVAWADELEAGEANVTIDIPRIEIKGASSDLSAPFTVSADYGFGDGSAHIEGSVIPAGAQIDLDLSINAFPLTMLATYAQEFGDLALKSGTVDFTGKLQSQPDDRMQVTGAVNIVDFAMATEQPNELEVSWQAFSLTGIDVMTNPMAIQVDQLNLNTPQTELRLSAPTSAEPQTATVTSATTEPETDAPLLDLVLNQLQIQAGSFTLIDDSVQPAGEFKIEQTELTLQNLSFDSPQPTVLDLKALVNQSQLSIKGQLYPANPKQDSTLKIDMNGLTLPSLSSYSGKAVGRKIKNGIFSLDANWTIKNSQLKASNKILIDQMSFGDKVDNDSAINLPLDLAVTLLKGVNGEMDLSLPLSGDLSDPKASVWQIVRTAAVGLITNVAAAPFKLLSNLVGSEADLSQVTFEANSNQLTSDSIERLNAIVKALNARPQISLSITPTLSNEDDAELAKAALRASLMANSTQTDDETYHENLKIAYIEQMKASQMSPTSESAQPNFTQMEASLLADIEIPVKARTELAQARATTVEQYLVTTSQIDQKRVIVQDVDLTQQTASVHFELK